MTTLAIDIETYSGTDLKKSGVYKYTEDPDFAILLFAYSCDDEPVEVVDLANGEQIPERVLNKLNNMFVKKTAYNAAFERVCISKHLGVTLPPNQWECTMVKAGMLGLPFGLDPVSKLLKLQQKLAEGAALIRYFCMPCKSTKTNNGRLRNLPEHDTQKWERFKLYCKGDVEVEQAIRHKISFFEIPETEKKLWKLDQLINDRGVLINPSLVKNAIRFDFINKERLTKKAVELTQLDNPNSVSQLKDWIWGETGDRIASLNKKELPKILENTDSDAVKELIGLRQEMSRTSVKKYAAMSRTMCSDNRFRGMVQFYGANRTGRWAGRLIQVHNLRKNELPDLDLARQFLLDHDIEALELLFGSIPDTLSQLIRTAFIAEPGSRLIMADFSAIEARVIAWLAGEKWRIDVFNSHGKIYEASAAQMFKVPLEKVTKGSDLRAKGKVAELALGYQGGPNALIKMGALEMGLQETELPELVSRWRSANSAIVRYWRHIQECALTAVQDGVSQNTKHGIQFSVSKGIMWIQLPSGRKLAYQKPRVGVNQRGSLALAYEGVNDKNKWGRLDTYGGKLVENIVQAIARDALAEAMLRLEKAGYKIVMHVHDEVILEMPEGTGNTKEVNRIMGESIPWAAGLPLKAESYESYYYRKD